MTQTQPVLEVTNLKVHYPVKGPLFSKKQTMAEFCKIQL